MARIPFSLIKKFTCRLNAVVCENGIIISHVFVIV